MKAHYGYQSTVEPPTAPPPLPPTRMYQKMSSDLSRSGRFGNT